MLFECHYDSIRKLWATFIRIWERVADQESRIKNQTFIKSTKQYNKQYTINYKLTNTRKSITVSTYYSELWPGETRKSQGTIDYWTHLSYSAIEFRNKSYFIKRGEGIGVPRKILVLMPFIIDDLDNLRVSETRNQDKCELQLGWKAEKKMKKEKHNQETEILN